MSIDNAREYFSYFRDVPKMVAINVGQNDITFVMAKREGRECSFIYEIVEADLYSIMHSKGMRSEQKAIKEIARIFNITPETEVYVSFSHDIGIVREALDEKALKVVQKHNIVSPLYVKHGLTTAAYDTWYVVSAKPEICRILNVLERCGIHASSVYISALALLGPTVYLMPFALSGAADAALSDDESFDINALIYLDYAQTLCYIMTHGHIYAFDCLAYGERDIIERCADRAGVNAVDYSHDRLATTASSDLLPAVREAMQGFDVFFSDARTKKELHPRKMIVCGPFAQYQPLINALGTLANVPAQTWGIRGKVKLNYDLEGKRKFINDEPALAPAVGLFSRNITAVQSMEVLKPARFLQQMRASFWLKKK